MDDGKGAMSETEKKKRYLIGYRPGIQRSEAATQKATQELEEFIAKTEGAESVKRTATGRQIVEMTPAVMAELAAKRPDLRIEEDRELDLFPMPGLPDMAVPSEARSSIDIQVQDADSGQPIPKVTVIAVGEGAGFKAETDQEGRTKLEVDESLRRIIVSPPHTYWSRVIEDVEVKQSSPLTVTLKPLKVAGRYSWGHRLMGFHQVNPYWSGRGINVGVIDTGITDKLQDLRPSGGLNTLDGADPNAWYDDQAGHGTHCAGVVASLHTGAGMCGGAPDANIYSLKVFPGGHISDLVRAVEWCIRNDMDVISMSLGSQAPSDILASVLHDAYDRGITCVAASGNSNTHVAYPAAFPNVIAVGAIGHFGTFPDDSGHALRVGRAMDWGRQLFSASFTNYGPELNVCAPGVAILSSVPQGFAAWDGTSMACPMVSALTALILEAYPTIRTGDSQQPEYVRSILTGAAANLGMPAFIQGAGLPLAPRALAAAQYRPQSGWPALLSA